MIDRSYGLTSYITKDEFLSMVCPGTIIEINLDNDELLEFAKQLFLNTDFFLKTIEKKFSLTLNRTVLVVDKYVRTKRAVQR